MSRLRDSECHLKEIFIRVAGQAREMRTQNSEHGVLILARKSNESIGDNFGDDFAVLNGELCLPENRVGQQRIHVRATAAPRHYEVPHASRSIPDRSRTRLRLAGGATASPSPGEIRKPRSLRGSGT